MIKSLYIHIPFCKRICPYCDFFKRVSSQKIMEEYKDSLIKEIELSKSHFNTLETIYIGGGTPSFYSYLKDILVSLRDNINLSSIKEFTIESTPETILDIKDLLKEFNINRVSIGVESFNPKTLSYLKRDSSSYEDIKYIIDELKSIGINNINLDFIYGLPFETYKSIKKTLKYINKLNVSHISFYDLIIEEKTELYHDLKNKKIELMDEDLNIKIKNYIDYKLNKLGFNKYEISNYSKPNFESIHNLSYWNLDEYIGLGAGAHSEYDNKRYENKSDLLFYINELKNNDLSNIKIEYDFDYEKEYFLMGLRKVKGVSLSFYKEKFNIDPLIKYPKLNYFIDNSILEIKNDYLRFTKKGMNLGNLVFEEFV